MKAGKNKRKNRARRAKRRRLHRSGNTRRKARTYKYSEDGNTLFELKNNGDVLRIVWEKQRGEPVPQWLKTRSEFR